MLHWAVQEIAWLLEPIGIWLQGGTWAEIKSSQGFVALLLLSSVLVPSSLIAVGIGTTTWRETPLAQWFGVDPREPDGDWAQRARDLDKDGWADF
ncbi:MAG: hypothetical protein AB7H66_09100 [Hyphomonadaceae bacterium]